MKKMKNYIRTLLLLTSVAVMSAACNDLDGNYDSLIPDEYDRILSFKSAGNVDLEMSVGDTDYKYIMHVLKGGSHVDQQVDAELQVLSQADVDRDYNEQQGLNYKVLSADMYRVTDYRLRIASGRSGMGAPVVFDASRIYAEMQKEENRNKDFVLPVQLTSQADSVNSGADVIVMHCTVLPASVSLMNERQQVTVPENEDVANIGIDVQKTGLVDAEIGFELCDQAYVDETYGIPEGVGYKVVPAEAITMEPAAQISAEQEFYSHNCQLDMVQFGALSAAEPETVWVLPVRLTSRSAYVGVDREVSLITLGYHTYETGDISTKDGWQVAYGTIAMPFGRYASMYDGIIDGEGWMGYINDGFPGSQNLGDPYVVIDLGSSSMISQAQVQLGYNGGYYDTMPVAIDFYVTDANSLNPDLSTSDRAILNAESNYGDPNTVSEDYMALHNRLREYDESVDWVKIGAVTGVDVSPAGVGLYTVNVPETILNKRIFSRYVKVVVHPAGPTVTTGDRSKIHEIYLQQVLKIDGKTID